MRIIASINRPTDMVTLADDTMIDFIREQFQVSEFQGSKAIENAMSLCVDDAQRDRLVIALLLLLGPYRCAAIQPTDDHTGF